MSSACGSAGSGGGPSMGMTGAQAAAVAREIQRAGERGTIASSAPYYSRVFVTAARVTDSAGPPAVYSYAVAAGIERRAFGYSKTENVPGYPTSFAAAGIAATPADTNLITKGQTLAGQTFLIQGLACIVQPTSDFEFARRLLTECSVSISLNGDQQTMEMGTPINLPGIGGLYGWGATSLVEPALSEAGASQFAKLGANGVPAADNFRRVPEGLIWRPAGKTDGTLVVKLRTERAIAYGPITSRVAASGIVAWAPASELVADLMFHLIGIAVSDSSVNF